MNSIEYDNLRNTLKNHAYCITMSIRAYGLIAGMQAENENRKHRGLSPAYNEDAFNRILSECQQDHNSVIMNMGNGIF